MMKFYEIHQIRDISYILLESKRKRDTDSDLNEEEISWNFSLFIAQLLSKSIPVLQLNKYILQNEIDDYNSKYSKKLTIDKLKEKQWVRFIFDEVEVPHSFFWFCKDINNINDLEQKYQKYFDEVYFIGFLYRKYGYDDSRKLKISEKNFYDIYNRFKTLYPKIPNVPTLLEKIKFEYKDDSFFYQPFYFQHVSNGKIAANLWMLLNEDDLSKKIKKWLLLLNQFYISSFAKFLSSDQIVLYSENIIQLLFQEEDLLYNKSEFKKWETDSHHLGHFNIDIFFQKNISFFSIPESDNIFLLWCSLEKHNYCIDIYSQECRKQYDKVLMSLLNMDDSKEYIKKILDEGHKYPYLFFSTLFHLKRNRPSDLLWFLTEEKYGIIIHISFIESCIEKLLEPNKNILESSIINLIEESTRIFIKNNFNTHSFNYIVFSRLLMLISKYNLLNDRRSNVLRIKNDIYNFHKELLLKSATSFLGKFDFQQLIDCFNEERNCIFTNNSGIKIPEFNYLFNLLEISVLQNNKTFSMLVTEEIKKLYKFNILDSTKLFLTSEYKEIESFNWCSFVNILIDKKEIDSFCNQTLDSYILPGTLDINEFDLNHTNADKYKLLLKVLCLVYQHSKYKDKIENIIMNYLPHCFVDDIKSKSINIFSSLYESSYTDNSNTSLFPFLLDCVNSFSKDNQDIFLGFILSNADFTLLFKAYNLIKFETGHIQIENFVKEKDFSSKIDEIYTVPDFINVVTEVTNSRLSKRFETILFEELQKVINDKAKEGYISEYTYQAELLKLFHLYKEKEINQLKDYKFPFDDVTQRYKEYQKLIESEKQFYLACIDMQNENYKDSYSKFEILTKNHPDVFKYKYYKLYIQSYIISDDEELKKLLKLVSEYLEKDNSEKELLLFVKLRIYLLQNDIDAALYFYNTLNLEIRGDIDFAYLIIKSLLENDNFSAAFHIFNEIKPEFYDTKEYKELRKLLPTEKRIAEFHNQYTQILCLDDEKRFSVLPDSINKHEYDLGKYFLNEIKHALNKTLKKIDLVEKISENQLSEDNISDLLELEINGRLSMIGYKLENQDRSGKSGTGKRAGEIDLEINLEDFSIIIEAVRYSSGSTKRKEHIEKTFNYDPSKRYIYNLIYFDSNKDFNSSWNKVLQEIKNANYPSGYELIASEEINSNNNGIKMAMSTHNNKLTYYHIMANFFYTK